MDFTVFETMWAYLWEMIYKILAIFGIVKNEEGNLEDATTVA
ncbi:MAG: hypothetical protein PUC33_03385 [Oscillospiraceae bacterium]|nr:hypothetical protein [Oscillospiraceae bacterium]